MPGCAGMVRVLSPVTLSLEVHWEDVSELSVTVTEHKPINSTLVLDTVRHHKIDTTCNIEIHSFPTEGSVQRSSVAKFVKGFMYEN